MKPPSTGRAAALPPLALCLGLGLAACASDSAAGDASGGDGAGTRLGSCYLPYNRLTDADIRRVSQAIDAPAEPLSQVSAKLVGS